MKKILYVVMALAIVGFVSCNNTPAQKGKELTKNAKANATDDSLSQLLGTNFGLMLNLQGDSGRNFKLDKEQFMAGLKEMIAFDTIDADQSYVEGLGYGQYVMYNISQMEQMYNIHFDKKLFVEAIEKAITEKNPSQEQLNQTKASLDKIFGTLQNKVMGGMKGAPQGAPQGAENAPKAADSAAAPAAKK